LIFAYPIPGLGSEQRRLCGHSSEPDEALVHPNLQLNRGQTRRSVGQVTEKSANVELARHMEGVRQAGHDKIWTVFKTVARPAS
jgi:hypothetical protein